jgi:hypothetical protein
MSCKPKLTLSQVFDDQVMEIVWELNRTVRQKNGYWTEEQLLKNLEKPPPYFGRPGDKLDVANINWLVEYMQFVRGKREPGDKTGVTTGAWDPMPPKASSPASTASYEPLKGSMTPCREGGCFVDGFVGGQVTATI